MILEAVESALITAMTEAVLLDRQLTIEHIMPRSWLEHWPLPGTADPGAKDERDRLVNTFGNLTLATGKLNPSMSNAAWQTKRAELQRHSALALNRELTRYDTWNEDLIRTRGEQLFAVALRVWPRPAVPVPEDEGEPAQRTERPPTPKEERHLRFWAALLERARQRTNLHGSASPRRGIYLAFTAGSRGLRYYYANASDYACVELHIETRNAVENNRIFDRLQRHQSAIDASFGDGLEWLPADGSRARRIVHYLTEFGYGDEARWPSIQDQMIDAMIRLDKSLRPFTSVL